MVKRPKKVLIVDDEESICASFKRIVNENFPGFEVDTAKNGFDAIEAFSRKRHDIIIMDIKMPVLDGVDAHYEIQTLCENREWQVPPIIFCTGFLPPNAVRDMLKQNPTCSLLLKPVMSKALVSEIKRRLMAVPPKTGKNPVVPSEDAEEETEEP